MSTQEQNENLQELLDTYATTQQADTVMNLRVAGYEFDEMKNYMYEDEPFDTTERYMFILKKDERFMLVLQSGMVMSPKPKPMTNQNQ